MIGPIWHEGRLSWLLVSFCVYATLCILAFDYTWRMIQTPFEVLAMSVLLIWLLGSIAMILLAHRLRRR